MKTAEKYKYWAMLSDYDMETAQVLMDNGRWVYVAYMCHQALERQLKGMFVYYMDKEAPKTHNLPFLFDKLRHCEGFPAIGTMDADAAAGYEDFFTEVMYYYMSDYPFSYKRIVSRFIDEETGRRLYQQVADCLAGLRAMQPAPEHVDIAAEQRSGRTGF